MEIEGIPNNSCGSSVTTINASQNVDFDTTVIAAASGGDGYDAVVTEACVVCNAFGGLVVRCAGGCNDAW